MLKAIIADCHGILIGKFPYEEYHSKTCKLLKKHGYDYEKAKAESLTISAFCEKHGFRDEYLKLLNSLSVDVGNEEELDELLSKLPFDIHIATDTSTKNLLETLQKSRLSMDNFKSMESGNTIREPKPSTEMYQKILKENNLKAEECLVIGDRITDIMPATELKIPALVCNHEFFIEIIKLLSDSYEKELENDNSKEFGEEKINF
jgi:HAD superfamily hydrolase (TIGR01549 family)